MVKEGCERCEGTGFLVDEAEGASVAIPCGCRNRPRTEKDLAAIGVPRRYVHCAIENYVVGNPHQRQAVAIARTFVDSFPAVDRGILFTGACGTGKTHLAVAILRQLVLEHGVDGAFADYQDLLKRIQATFQRHGEGSTEDEILAPVLEAELLVLDDLGSRRSTAWAEETLGHLLNVRYNEERTTILTTNLVDIEVGPENRAQLPEDTHLLSERVSERVLSRVHEMCRVVHLEGHDWRRRSRG